MLLLLLRLLCMFCVLCLAFMTRADCTAAHRMVVTERDKEGTSVVHKVVRRYREENTVEVPRSGRVPEIFPAQSTDVLKSGIIPYKNNEFFFWGGGGGGARGGVGDFYFRMLY